MDRAAADQEIVTWPVEERLDLIDRVWDDLVDSEWQPPLTDVLRAELHHRVEAADANPGDVVSRL
ncbi:MAG TPA: addiction module protein [Gemmataceae bacterium]|nr:addiction module protein [Gemmataceae bacterium]